MFATTLTDTGAVAELVKTWTGAVAELATPDINTKTKPIVNKLFIIVILLSRQFFYPLVSGTRANYDLVCSPAILVFTAVPSPHPLKS
jgi:hypothetical protein